jgi:DNA-directed RNA polymerase subunit RPC12/RpoP
LSMKKAVTQKIEFKEGGFSTKKKTDEDSYVCTNCGYSGHGKMDEDTHELVCPECGSNLEETDILKMKTPDSYDDEGDNDFELGDDKPKDLE